MPKDKKPKIGCITCGLSTRVKEASGKPYLRRGKKCPVCNDFVHVGPLLEKEVHFTVTDARRARKKEEMEQRRVERSFVGIRLPVIPRAEGRSTGLEAYEWDPAA